MTSTWPSQPGPAPMPMVGTGTAAVTSAASGDRHALEHDGVGAGVGQRARARPGSSPAGLGPALHRSRPAGAATAASGPRGPSPGCPAATRRATSGATSSPPSSFTASAPLSFSTRPGGAQAVLDRDLVAHEGQVDHHVRAGLTPRTTARA